MHKSSGYGPLYSALGRRSCETGAIDVSAKLGAINARGDEDRHREIGEVVLGVLSRWLAVDAVELSRMSGTFAPKPSCNQGVAARSGPITRQGGA
jgi:hypothetical protein